MVGRPVFYQGYDGLYFGWKAIQISEKDKRITTEYMVPRYTYDVQWEQSYCTLQGEVTEQDIMLDVPVLDAIGHRPELTSFRIWSSTLAGMHVNPFVFHDGGLLPIDEEVYRPTYIVPAGFQGKDVVFFDGWDVSVKKIWIPLFTEVVPAQVLAPAREEFEAGLAALRALRAVSTGASEKKV